MLLAWARSGPATARTIAAWRALGDAAGTLDRAGVSAQGRRFHQARRARQGPALGAALHEAEAAWIAADFPADGAAIAAIADAAAADVRPM